MGRACIISLLILAVVTMGRPPRACAIVISAPDAMLNDEDRALVHHVVSKPLLAQLTLDDAISKSRAYMDWQAEFNAMDRYEADLKRLSQVQMSNWIGSQLVGRNGLPFAWAMNALGAFNIVVPASHNTPLFGVMMVGLSVPFWHVTASLLFSPHRKMARRALERRQEPTLKTSGVDDLVGAIAAYDVTVAAVDKHFMRRYAGARYERLTRRWLMRFVRGDRRILKGWLVRYLQTLPSRAPGEAAPKLLAGPMIVEIETKYEAPLGAAETRDVVTLNRFRDDVRGQPRRWRRALREMIPALEGHPELRARATELLDELNGLNLVEATVQRSVTRAGWWCELALVNADALFKKP